MSIQLKRQKSPKFQFLDDPHHLFYIKKTSQNSFSEYYSKKRKFDRIPKYLNVYEKQVLKRQQLQNERLLRKITQIQNRKSALQQIHEQKLQKHLLNINKSSKRFERQKQQQTIQHQNDILVEKIVRMRKVNSQLSKSQNKYKRNMRSVLLPRIQQNYTQKTQS